MAQYARSASTRNQTQKNQSVVYIALAIIGVVAFAGFMMRPDNTASRTAEQESVANGPRDFLMLKAKESQGEINRLPLIEQQQIQGITGGKGAETLRELHQQK